MQALQMLLNLDVSEQYITVCAAAAGGEVAFPLHLCLYLLPFLCLKV